MHISRIFEAKRPTFSFEFFPPKTEESMEKLYQTIRELKPLNPAFVSVTYGAGGSTRHLTHSLVERICQKTSITPIPHLTCTAHTLEEIDQILTRYSEVNISNVLALRGDPPKGTEYKRSQDYFQHAADLVAHIKKFSHPTQKEGFGIGVAGFPEGHPATPNRLLEMDYLKAKVDAGADYIATQLFFDNHSFFDFRDRCRLAGINIPIIAGIMPVTSLSGLKRMAELSGGTNFPASLLKALNRCGENSESVSRVGIHYAAQQCSELLNNDVDGIHFYTLNQSKATREIYLSLGLMD